MQERITLRAARHIAGKTQEETAKALNISKNTLVKWESGAVYPRVNQFFKLCRFYGVPASDIFVPEK